MSKEVCEKCKELRAENEMLVKALNSKTMAMRKLRKEYNALKNK